ncbi:medium chain dehydrogenase/reductase family protein [Streptomyces sp. NPDC006645]|uniref:medium chain dehydrogenase/reductase family protein n=1 Tax=unclassified Streptomyces TaxID=2593676 RepID=UPI0033BF7A89
MITEVVLPGVVEPDGLELRTRPTPPLRPGQALVRMEATGISFAEQQMRRGRYFNQPPFPFVPGYDVVGVIHALGDDGHAPSCPSSRPSDRPSDPPQSHARFAVGRRVAALTKTGAWADRLVLPLDELVAVPDSLTAEEAETVIVNGITARRMLSAARVRGGDTIVVLGANGGVGSLLVQLARHAGARVIGVASARHALYLRELGAVPVDRHGDFAAEIRRIAPRGVAAVFDHVGGPGIRRSFSLLARGGVLVAYGTAAARDRRGNAQLPVYALFARLLLWRVLPNGRSTTFFNLWAGRRRNPRRHRVEVRADLEAVFDHLAAGHIAVRIARAFPLSQIAEAMRYAESGAVEGKVVLLADPC